MLIIQQEMEDRPDFYEPGKSPIPAGEKMQQLVERILDIQNIPAIPKKFH